MGKFASASFALAMLAAPAAAADFNLKGKTVTIYIAGGAGGGIDAYARTFAPYLAKNLPGEPTIVSSNMPGGGGAQAVQYLYNVAAKDGTAIGTTNAGPVSEPQLGGMKVNYDIGKFRWIGSLAKGNTVCAAWHSSSFKNLEDVKAREMTIASTGATSAPARAAWLMNALIGTKIKPISGYNGGTALLAIERGEVDGTCITLNSLLSTRPQWIRDNQLRLLFFVAMEQDKGYEQVPLALNEIKSPEDRLALEFYLLPYEFNNPFMLPPGVSDDVLNVYRQAFERAVKDPEYLAEAEKRGQPIKTENGQRVSEYVEKMLTMPQAIIDRTKAAIDPIQGEKK